MDDRQRREVALAALRGRVERSKRRGGTVGIHNSFVRSSDGYSRPPLARLIQGGRGGEVRLKLFLCMTMMATRAPHDINRSLTPQGWARMLALPVEDGAARRVSSNLKWLHDERFIILERRAGNTPKIQLLDPALGEPASRPSSHFVSVPLDLWNQGWILELSATDLTLLLVLLDLCGGATGPRYVTRFRRESYGLSPDTWTRARKKLEKLDLLSVGRTPQGDDYDPERWRNTYWISRDVLSRPPISWN